MSSNHCKFSLILNTIMIMIILLINSTASEPEQTIYSLLSANNLPTGIFPKGISNYSFDPTTNRFDFHLAIPSSSCDSKFETSLRYDSRVSGLIGPGRIADLKGIAAQELFLWLPVEEIKVDVPSTGLIYFDVGVVNKQFLASYFEDPVDCVVSGGEEGVEMVDVSFLRQRNRIIRNQPGKDLNGIYSGQEKQAVS